jgi:hypothetical protein
MWAVVADSGAAHPLDHVATTGTKGATVMSHHELYAQAVMADRMREARAARRAKGQPRAPRRGHRFGHGIVALIARIVPR